MQSQTLQLSLRTRGLMAAILSGVSYGFLGFFCKNLFQSGLSVTDVLLLRFLLSTFFIFVCLVVLKEWKNKPNLKVRFKNMVLGSIGFGISSFLFFTSMKLIPTGIANVLMFQNPLVVFVLTWCFVKKPPSRQHFIGIILCFIGILLIFKAEVKDSYNLFGILSGAGSAIWYGVYLFLSEKDSRKASPLWTTFDVLIGSSIILALWVCWLGKFSVPSRIDLWGHLLGTAILGTVVPVLTILYAIRMIGAREASVLSSLEPAVTLIVGYFLLQEYMSIMQIMGALSLISSAIVISVVKVKTKSKEIQK